MEQIKNNQNIESTNLIEEVSVLFDGNEMQIEDIHVKIYSQLNEHVSVQITGMVKVGGYDNYVRQANSAKGITIKHHIKGVQTLLYEGLIVEIKAHLEGASTENAVYWIEIQALSYTHLLDIQLIYRSFQNKEMFYDEMVDKVLKKHEDASCMLHAPKGMQQQVFVLQYHDTDWEFLIREISKFEEALYPDATLPKARFHMGKPTGTDRGQLEQYNYTISKNLNRYRSREKNILEHEISEFDFMEYQIFDAYATTTFQLGDPVRYQEISLYVCEVFSEIKNNKLYNTYKLTTANGLKMPRLSNNDIQGLSIPGTVIAVEENRLKLHLEIDEEQDSATAYWFDYAAFYATWYCMPEINDIVNLHFPTTLEQDALGLNSFKQNPGSGYKRNNQSAIPPNTSAAGKPGAIDFEKSASDPDVKILTTKSGRMIQLGPDSVTIQFDEGTFLILHDSDGIVLETDQDISLHAKGKIQAHAEDNIELEADSKITLRNHASSIEIEPGSIKIKSADTKMN